MGGLLGTPTCGSSGRCITYDAFGRMVESSTSATWTEYWYTQVPSSRVAMNATTLKYGYWPSPGRGSYLENSGAHYFIHPDWLGNGRIVSFVSDHSVAVDRAYAPYGEQYNSFGSTDTMYWSVRRNHRRLRFRHFVGHAQPGTGSSPRPLGFA